MSAANTLLARAAAAHRAGQIALAAAEYRRILAIDPGHPRAQHLLGFALLQLGSPADAVPMLTAALRQRPVAPEPWAHLGLALNRLGRTGEARTALRRALVLAPAHEDAAAGLLEAAVEQRDRATGRLARRFLAVAPGRSAGWHRLGLDAARRAGDTAGLEAAERLLRRAVTLSPGDRASATDLANLRRSLRQPDAACRFARWALSLNPRSHAARVVISAALLDLDRDEAASRMAMTAAVLAPSASEGYGNLAQCHYGEARFEAALAVGRRACAAAPRDPQLLANLATYHLACGDLESGWGKFRHRPARRGLKGLAGLPPTAWAGEPAAVLLVLAEQGLGDELLFASCWPDLARAVRQGRLGRVVVELDPRLQPLARRSFPELEWLARTDGSARRYGGVPATCWAAAGDLPALLRRSLEDFPAAPGYLVPDRDRVDGFRVWLESVAPGRRRFGLCWRSGLKSADRRRYYPRLGDCLALRDIPDSRLVALQYDDVEAELSEAWPAGGPALLIPPGLDRRDDLEGVAALIAALDGVLSADTAVLALAGAVGAPTVAFGRRPTWVALGQPGSPWHPSVTGVHRTADETWEELMRRIAREFAELRRPGRRAAAK